VSSPRKFRKKPVVIEAMQFTGLDSLYVLSPWLSQCNATYRAVFGTPPELEIQTLEGLMTAQFGDWIIKGVEGEFYPCKSSIFDATYEEAE